MRKLFARKRTLVLALVAVLALSAGAFAYWTAQGTGSGTASVGTDSGVSISPVSFTGTLYPGGSVPVSFTVNNLSANATAKVDKVVADTSAGTNGITGLPAGCNASDFHFADVSVNYEIEKSGSKAGSGTLTMDNTSVNQDACKLASPVLHLKVDNSGI
jgi:hypothetical protein